MHVCMQAYLHACTYKKKKKNEESKPAEWTMKLAVDIFFSTNKQSKTVI